MFYLGNCLHPCNVSFNWGIWEWSRYQVSNLVLRHGIHELQITLTGFCSRTISNWSSPWERTLSVECNDRSADYGFFCKSDDDCETNAKCIPKGEISTCDCKSNHIWINGHCCDANVPIGGACESDIQCRDKTYSGVCLNSICRCGEGNNAIENGCFAADSPVNGVFVPYIQCKDRIFSDVCLNSTCRCGEGFISEENKCLAANVSIGGECVSDTQCSDVNYNGVCVNSICSCREGYFSLGNKCLSGNVTLGGYCSLKDQCSGSIHADVCRDEKCVCKSGYVSYNLTCYLESNFDNMCFSGNKTCRDSTRECSIAHNQYVGMCVCKSEYLGFGENCLKGNLAINQTCERNEQCTAVHDLECQNGTCMCRDGHVPVKETYCKPLGINGKDAAKLCLNQKQGLYFHFTSLIAKHFHNLNIFMVNIMLYRGILTRDFVCVGRNYKNALL
ncbi:prion-like-(Q/N-rich) domain-bearing protein 25 [Saccostrea cucullata]|uniref:prion-like-(Q/N-rich) domain-bearing protein 25 n=1 Tax=Saccostrea cuccullata TaxID=36930 RepID=UPI002ECFE9E3